MPFEKGRDKTGGRQKGSVNKTTEKSRALFKTIMDGQQDRIEEALNEIYKEDKKQYLYVLNKYFPYYMPRQEQLDISVDTTEVPFDIKIESRKKTDTE